jgi:hypothetical protein
MATRNIHVHALTTTTQLLAEAPSRSYLLIQNDGDDVVYLGIGVDAVTNTGIRLNANGGSFEMSRATNNLSGKAINGISAADHVVCGIEEY